MTRISALLASAALLCAAAPAATTSTVLTVNATAKLAGTSFAIAGTAAFTGGIGSGNIVSNVSLTSIDSTGQNAVADYTITFASSGTLTGKLTVPVTLLTAGAVPSASVKITVTGGTGTYAGATSGATAITLTGAITGDIVSGYSLNNFTSPTFTITTSGSGGPTGPPVPTISAVLDSASNTPTLAPGSIFIVKGTTLCPSGTNFFNVPRPTTAPDGVKITFTPAGGAGTDSILVYEYNPSGTCQLAAILPSTVAPGTYNVTVTNGTASAPFSAQVVQRKPALFTQDSSGGGLASAQNYISASRVDLNSFTTGTGKGTTISPAAPGQFMIAYGTGLGALVGGDNSASPSHDYNADPGVAISVVVGGVSGPVAYAGRAGYAGEDQINFILPANAPTGCTVSLQLNVNGILSNSTFIAIAPDATSGVCVQPGFTPDQLKKLDGGGTLNVGGFSISSISASVAGQTAKIESVSGGFLQYTGYQLGSGGGSSTPQPTATDSCLVSKSVTTSSGTPAGTVNYLDAGAISLSGPAASSINNLSLTKSASNLYSASIGGFAIPGQPAPVGQVAPGAYTLKGNGGTGVGAFTASLTMPNLFSVTGGLPATVTEASGLPLNWTGGNSSDLVLISGSSSTTTGTAPNLTITATAFVCTTTAGKGGFTVPASILTQLPKTANGSLIVFSLVNGSTFTAPLTAGGSIDVGLFSASVGTGNAPTYQ